ncbi:hypothetical protein ACFQ2K_03505 [Streptomyces sanglieri]|uniref:Uncharacterized protein n=1 Tax=Streptomyces sanglieri TaxID=193460 RepID=A0ABW2WMD0_9ACTN
MTDLLYARGVGSRCALIDLFRSLNARDPAVGTLMTCNLSHPAIT